MPENRLLVAICTHNPKAEYLEETLAHLKQQTLPTDDWDLILVDNASTNQVAKEMDLSWHSSGRYVLESTLGLAAARVRVFDEAQASGCDTILFVDDDNLLNPDFLEMGMAKLQEHPNLGVWGGQLLPRYEVTPPSWFGRFEKYIAVFALDEDMVSAEFQGNHDILPAGAGMFTRLSIGRDFVKAASQSPLRMKLGVKGKGTMRGEDTDFALYALNQGFQVGRFRDLSLTHIIPEGRISKDYIAAVLEGTAASAVVIRYLHEGKPAPSFSLMSVLKEKWQTWRLPEPQRSFFSAERRGVRKGAALLAQIRDDGK